MAFSFTKIYNRKDGTIGRKKDVHLTRNISYIEPVKIRDNTNPKSEPIDCTKLYYCDSFIIVEMRMLDFIEQMTDKLEFV